MDRINSSLICDSPAALVTGAGRRLGAAIARALADRGFNLIIHYNRSASGARETADYAGSVHRESLLLQLDLENPSAGHRLFELASQRFTDISILVNSASVFERASPLETNLSTWNRHIAINLTTPFFLSQAFIQARNGRPGSILNMIDFRATRPEPQHAAYGISKAGLLAMTQCLARAYPDHIRVNGIAPGTILPPPPGSADESVLLKRIPAKRWGTIEETVETAMFLLLGPTYITGEIIALDGGRHLI